MSRAKKIILLVICIVLLAAAYFSYVFYRKIFSPNVLVSQSEMFIYIPTGSDVASVANMLKAQHIVKNINTFLWLANKKNYSRHVYAGKYLIKNGMNNNQLVNLLRSGKQTPVEVTFNNVRTTKELAGKIGNYIEADSIDFIQYFDTTSFFIKKNISKENILTVFIPNTYQFYWNTSADEFVKKMYKEYNTFWNEERKNKASQLGLTQQQVYTLASIVYAETKMSGEAKRMAGTYMNRLQKNIPMQSDPTLIFALGNFTIKRVLNEDKMIDSPYNTYLHTGLPPGPICMPPVNYIDAVLDYEKNDYLYFAAKEDFSGYHNFAKTLEEHNLNARRYREALNKQGIYR